MLRGEKSLIFARCVNSAYELERRLLDQWEDAVYKELKELQAGQLQSKPLERLLDNFRSYREHRLLHELLDYSFEKLVNRIQCSRECKVPAGEEALYEREHMLSALEYVYDNLAELKHGSYIHELLALSRPLSRTSTWS